MAGVDFGLVFSAMTSPYAVLSPALEIVAVNDAYCAAAGRTREQLLGRPLLELSDLPGSAAGMGAADLGASLATVLTTHRPHTLPLQQHDGQDPVTGARVERHWSIVNKPVLDEAGQLRWVLHRPQEITDYVVERQRRARPVDLGDRSASWPGDQDGAEWGYREAESDVYAQAVELQAAWRAESATGRRLAGLVEVAHHLGNAQTIDEVIEAVVAGAATALASERTAICRAIGADRVVMIRARGAGMAGAQQQELAAGHRWPAVVTATTGHPTVLPDRAACLAWSPAMPALLAESGCESFVSVPMRIGARLLGSLTVGWSHPRSLDSGERQTLEALAAQCAQALGRVSARAAERQSAAASRSMAEVLQRSLLTDPVQPDHLQICTRYVPAASDAEVGGDWYDAFICQDGSTWLVVGDVAGHDQTAAAVMAQVRNLLRGIAYTLQESPAAVLGALDRAMGGLGVRSLTTVVAMRIEQTDADAAAGIRRVRWSNAGHPMPLLLHPDGTVTPLTARPELLLGADTAALRSDHELVLHPGAGLLLYSDGLVERRGTDLDQGAAWLTTAVQEWAGQPLDVLCDNLLDAVAADADDDVALLALRAHREDRPRPAEAGPQRLP